MLTVSVFYNTGTYAKKANFFKIWIRGFDIVHLHGTTLTHLCSHPPPGIIIFRALSRNQRQFPLF